MNIRPAQPRDLDLCVTLDPSYETDHVWQMETTRATSAISVGFRVTRLPRTMKVASTAVRDVLLEHYEQGECFLIAEENDEIRGYLDATADMWKRLARINYLTVAQAHRRSGIAKALVREMLDWGHNRNLETVIVETQTKNYPASSLFQKLGFTFCGFNDHYYSNRDIAIFFALNLH
jgi:ribosomal protein S18 acetylase RimI-like enzyme